MPTSILRQDMVGPRRPHTNPASFFAMPEFFGLLTPGVGMADEVLALAGSGDIVSTNALTASRVYGYMITVTEPAIVRSAWWTTYIPGGSADNADAGIFTEDCTTKLLSTTSTAIAASGTGTLEVQLTAVNKTWLPCGRYWCCFIKGGTNGQVGTLNPSSASLWRAVGCAQEAGSGSSLGSTFTPAAIAGTHFPLFGFSSRE